MITKYISKRKKKTIVIVDVELTFLISTNLPTRHKMLWPICINLQLVRWRMLSSMR